jgi:hypothetical protein
MRHCAGAEAMTNRRTLDRNDLILASIGQYLNHQE